MYTRVRYSTYLLIFKSKKGSSEALSFLAITSYCYWGDNNYFVCVLLEYYGIVVATKLPTPMADKPQLLAHLSGFTPLLFSGVLLQHCTYSLLTATPSHLQCCQTLLVVGKDIQWPHQDMHIHSLSLGYLYKL